MKQSGNKSKCRINKVGVTTENTEEEMVSSHQVKRFFKAFGWLCGGIFRKAHMAVKDRKPCCDKSDA